MGLLYLYLYFTFLHLLPILLSPLPQLQSLLSSNLIGSIIFSITNNYACHSVYDISPRVARHSFGLLTLENCTYWLSRNVGKNLQTYAAQHPRTEKFSCRNFLFCSSKMRLSSPYNCDTVKEFHLACRLKKTRALLFALPTFYPSFVPLICSEYLLHLHNR